MCKRVFKTFLNLINCCNNYIYNLIDVCYVSEFELHDVTAILAMIYKKILEYLELQFSAKCD